MFARLVELGDGDARQVADTADAESYEGAWARIFSETISGEVSVTALSALHRVAPDEFQARVGDLQDEVTVTAKLKDLDRTAESVKE